MKRLEDASLIQRIVTTFIIVIVVLLLLALIGWATGGWEVQSEQRKTSAHNIPEILDLPISKYEAEILALDHKAIDDAYVKHVALLFENWMKDFEVEGQRQRIKRGSVNSRNAYISVLDTLAERERQLKEHKP